MPRREGQPDEEQQFDTIIDVVLELSTDEGLSEQLKKAEEYASDTKNASDKEGLARTNRAIEAMKAELDRRRIQKNN